MCGRYSLALESLDTVQSYFETELLEEAVRMGWKARHQIAPTQFAPIVTLGRDGLRRIQLFRWGFGEKLVFNARSETAHVKPLFRGTRRCLVPADAFYEWPGKVQTRIRAEDEDLFAFAGLWDARLVPKTGELVDSFTILTRSSADVPELAQIHDRLPVALTREQAWAWLNPSNRLAQFLPRFRWSLERVGSTQLSLEDLL